MAASGSGSGMAGICDEKRLSKDDCLAHGLDKTMDGISMGSMDDDVTEKGKGKKRKKGMFDELAP